MISDLEALAHLHLELHKPEPGGCTCGFCVYSVEHVLITFARDLQAALPAELEAAIGKPVGKDFIPPSESGEGNA